ncbi:MAG: DUF1707 domain-containing protein [Propionibacteriaceae bacterium]
MSQSFFDQPFPGQRLVVGPAAGPVRIGDAERDRAVSLLGDHFAAGRLDREELDERIDQAMQAKFSTDLRPLFADLPGAEPPAGRPTAPFRGGPPAYAPLFFLAPMLLIGLMVTAIAVGAPWLLWVVFWVFMFSRFWGRRRFHQHAHTHRQPPPGYRR